MFFKVLGSIVARHWLGIILLWFAAVTAAAVFVPDLGEVARDDRAHFLPPNSDSILAKKMLDHFFPKESFQSRAIVVVEKESALSQRDLEWLETHLHTWVRQAPQKNIRKVITPLTSELMRSKLVSRDGKAAMAVLNLSTHYVAKESQATVRHLLEKIRETPHRGLTVALTADAVVGYDYHLAIRDSLHRTTWATVLLLCGILLFIFRSPVTPIIPMLTIGISFFLAKASAALCALGGLVVSPLTEILLVVVLFGAGTDYCVFLVFRYCEEISKGEHPTEAVKTTLTTVGEAISSSALTVIIGIGCLLFAQFGPFRQTGPYIALGLAIALAAGLTLTPSLILAMRRILFWPSGIVRYDLMPEATKWATHLVTRRPLAVVVGLLLLLSPCLYFGVKAERSFDLLRELPDHFASRQGLTILKKHFSRGEMSPLVLVLESETPLHTPAGLDRLYQLSLALSRRREVNEVRSAAWPTGDPKTLEKGLLKNQVEKVKSGLRELADGNLKIQNGLDEIRGRLKAREKEVKGNILAGIFAGGAKAELAQLLAALTQLSDGARRVSDGLRSIEEAMQNWTQPGSGALPALEHLALPPDILEKEPRLKDAFDYYLTPAGGGTRLTLVLKATPYSKREKDDLLALKAFLKDQIRQIFPGRAQFHFAGSGSTILDQRLVTQKDFYRVICFVLGGVFVILIFLLGRGAAPLYLIATMILNYYASLGMASLAFEHIQGLEGMDWKVPFFMFVLLVALGEDYNIFFMARVKEERRKSGIHEAVRVALLRTGPLIGLCGIILAGTFATLILSPLEAFIQMGFGIAVGVLLATFVVVPLLVPSLALLADRFARK